jgi:hypothetical protein
MFGVLFLFIRYLVLSLGLGVKDCQVLVRCQSGLGDCHTRMAAHFTKDESFPRYHFINLNLHFSFFSPPFSDPAQYLVRDAAAERKFKFTLDEAIQKANESPMLSGHRCYITSNVQPEPTQMAGMKCN